MNAIKKYVFIACAILGANSIACSEAFSAKDDSRAVAVEDEVDTDLSPLLKSGKVMWQLYFIHGRFSVRFYKTPGGDYLYLPLRMDSMNKMLADRVSKESAAQYIEKNLSFIARSLFSDPVSRNNNITERYVVGKSAEDKKILQQYILSGKSVAVDENKWQATFNMATEKGAIETWSISGTVEPLAVTAFSKTLRKPNGTLAEGRYIGGFSLRMPPLLSENNTRIRTLWDDDNNAADAFPWIKSGKMMWQLYDIHGRFATWFYKTRDGNYLYLPMRIDSMNAMLAAEVEKGDAVHFIKNEMKSLIQYLLSDPVSQNNFITEPYVKVRSQKDQEILRPFISSDRDIVVNNDNTWMATFNVATENGAIEAWLVSGTVDPLAIARFSKTIIKPSETLRSVQSSP